MIDVEIILEGEDGLIYEGVVEGEEPTIPKKGPESEGGDMLSEQAI